MTDPTPGLRVRVPRGKPGNRLRGQVGVVENEKGLMTMIASTPPPLKFTETDAARAYHEWRCNCGPSALAACLGWTLDQVRPHLADFETRGTMNPTQMIAALISAGFARKDAPSWPMHGLVRIQWGGPWLKPEVPKAAAYQHTHWVASKRDDRECWVYDINGGWTTFDAWEATVVPPIVAGIKRCDGTWEPSHCWEVRRNSA